MLVFEGVWNSQMLASTSRSAPGIYADTILARLYISGALLYNIRAGASYGPRKYPSRRETKAVCHLAWLYIAIILLAIFAIYAFCSAPSRRGRTLELPRLYAHRGLHGKGASENSLEAFERACRAGVGIELDVRLSADDMVVVFHDDTLERLCGQTSCVDAMTLAQLKTCPLPDGTSIPTLEEVLALVAGRVPLLIEIKNGRNLAWLCALTLERLRAYPGEYVVESFNPLAMRYFRRYAAHVPRGQLVSLSDGYLGAVLSVGAGALSHLMANFLSRPDFVAYDRRMQGVPAMHVQRTLHHTRLAIWTVHSRAELRKALARGESVIFEVGQGDDPIDPENPAA